MHLSVAQLATAASHHRIEVAPPHSGPGNASTRAMPRRVQWLFVFVRHVVVLVLTIATIIALLVLMAVLTWLLGAA
jgi:hypothetical protein